MKSCQIASAFLMLLGVATCFSVDETLMYKFNMEREVLKAIDQSFFFNASTYLCEKERRANEVLQEYMSKARKYIMEEKQIHDPASHPFYDYYREAMDTSIYNALYSMPKGASLHQHEFAFNPASWVVRELTYENVVYFDEEDQKIRVCPISSICPPSAIPMSEYRKKSCPTGCEKCLEALDKDLEKHFMITKEEAERSIKEGADYTWTRFDILFVNKFEMLNYLPFFKKYYMQGFQEFVNQGIYHLEMRWFIDESLLTETGERIDAIQMYDLLKEMETELQRNNPDLPYKPTIRYILLDVRVNELDQIDKLLEKAILLKKHFGDLIVGYDLASKEAGSTMYRLVPVLLNKKKYEEQHGVELPFVFHAGETLILNDDNLLDAILLGTKRIGHGIALSQHPYLMDLVKTRGIAIESNPVSNHMLRYTGDLRNHPHRVLLANGVILIISSDDPGLFDYEGVTHDWFIAAFSWELDLSGLKQLALNSIRHSLLLDNEKTELERGWLVSWEKWVDEVNSGKFEKKV